MLRFIKQFDNLNILSLQIGRPIGKLIKPIINPNNLRIVAFDCTVNKEKKDLVLFIDDIRETDRDGVIVNSYDDLMATDELVRLKELRSINFKLLGKKVITEKKVKVGVVADFAIEDDSYFIMKLYVRPTVSRLLGGNLVIDRRQVVEVTDKVIVVKDSTVAESRAQATPSMEPVN